MGVPRSRCYPVEEEREYPAFPHGARGARGARRASGALGRNAPLAPFAPLAPLARLAPLAPLPGMISECPSSSTAARGVDKNSKHWCGRVRCRRARSAHPRRSSDRGRAQEARRRDRAPHRRQVPRVAGDRLLGRATARQGARPMRTQPGTGAPPCADGAACVLETCDGRCRRLPEPRPPAAGLSQQRASASCSRTWPASAASGHRPRPGVILAALEQREKLGTTGIGDGIAIPHARRARASTG